MKQKITLEIQNDTGVEFEEVAECSKLRMGEYYVDIDGKVQRSDYSIVGCKCIVLTPKIDHELEEAKRLVGKYVKYKSGDPTLFLVDEVSRSYHGRLIVFFKGSPSSVSYEDCQPFPIPTWRCCDHERPRKDGRYFFKDIDGKFLGVANYSVNDGWYDLPGIAKCHGWLDEGANEQ